MAHEWHPVKREDPYRLAMAEYVGIINQDPARGEYVRARATALTEAGEPLGVAIFAAAAEYHADSPEPRKEYAVCPNERECTNRGDFPPYFRWRLPCGRPAQVYQSGSPERPDMAYCETCARWFVVKPTTQRTENKHEADKRQEVGGDDWYRAYE